MKKLEIISVQAKKWDYFNSLLFFNILVCACVFHKRFHQYLVSDLYISLLCISLFYTSLFYTNLFNTDLLFIQLDWPWTWRPSNRGVIYHFTSTCASVNMSRLRTVFRGDSGGRKRGPIRPIFHLYPVILCNWWFLPTLRNLK